MEQTQRTQHFNYSGMKIEGEILFLVNYSLTSLIPDIKSDLFMILQPTMSCGIVIVLLS